MRSKVTVRSSSLGVKFYLGMLFGIGVWLLGLSVEISPTEIFLQFMFFTLKFFIDNLISEFKALSVVFPELGLSVKASPTEIL